MLAFSPIVQPAVRCVGLDLYVTTERWSLAITNRHGQKIEITVEAGTFFDGASVPPIGYWVMQRMGLASAAALVHDVIFETRGEPHHTYFIKIDGQGVSVPLTLRFTNELFEDVLTASNYPRWRGRPAAFLVRRFSPALWERYPTIINRKMHGFGVVEAMTGAAARLNR